MVMLKNSFLMYTFYNNKTSVQKISPQQLPTPNSVYVEILVDLNVAL